MEHDWIFIITMPITRKEVDRVMGGGRLVFRKLDPSSAEVRDAHMGCMRCEMTLNEAINRPCPGEPSGYSQTGVPYWDD